MQAKVQIQQVADNTDRLIDAARRIPEFIDADGFARQLSRFLDKPTTAATIFRPEWRESASRDLQALLGNLLSAMMAKGIQRKP